MGGLKQRGLHHEPVPGDDEETLLRGAARQPDLPAHLPQTAVALGLLFLLLPLLLFLTFFTPAGLGGLGGFGFLPPLVLQVDVAVHFFLPLLFAMMLCSITAGDILA
jgi:hypothetical protein